MSIPFAGLSSKLQDKLLTKHKSAQHRIFNLKDKFHHLNRPKTLSTNNNSVQP
jgi:hypothetical protein